MGEMVNKIKKITIPIRKYIDENRNSIVYKIASPFKHYISENYKKKDCFYFPELNLIYHHSPKCGGTTIYRTLSKRYKYVRINKNKAIKKDNIFHFTFVRNPYSRIVSSYSFNTKGINFRKKFRLSENSTFDEYVKMVEKNANKFNSDMHFKSLSKHLKINGSISYFDFIGKIENFQDDFIKLCKILEISPQSIKHENKTKHKPWGKYYTPILKKKVYQIYKDDFINFGYKK